MTIWEVLFAALMLASVAVLIWAWREDGKPFERPDPHDVFRWLPRERRADYARRMRGTLVVQYRDERRAVERAKRDLLTALMERPTRR